MSRLTVGHPAAESGPGLSMCRGRSLFLLATALAVAGATPGCRTRVPYGTSNALTRDSVGWHSVAPAEGGVRVQMPVYPSERTGTDQDEDGARRVTTFVHGEARFGYFGLFIARWEGGLVGDPLPRVGELASEIFQRVQIRRESSRRLAVDGFYAREDVGTDGRGAFVALRQFVGDDRVIMAVAVVQRTPDQLRIAEHFMQSIELDGAHALFPVAGARRADGEWTPVYLPEADFGITLPTAPVIREQEVTLAGHRATSQTFQSEDGWGIYRVRVVAFGGDPTPDGAFEALRQALQADHEVRPVHAGGFPGRVFTRDEGANRRWIRIYQTVGRLYVVEAVGPRASIRDRSVGHRLLAYFQSFRIL